MLFRFWVCDVASTCFCCPSSHDTWLLQSILFYSKWKRNWGKEEKTKFCTTFKANRCFNWHYVNSIANSFAKDMRKRNKNNNNHNNNILMTNNLDKFLPSHSLKINSAQSIRVGHVERPLCLVPRSKGMYVRPFVQFFHT